MNKMVLPAFLMDCRDWLVIDPQTVGLPETRAESPLLAVLSTAVVGVDDLRSASGVLTVGLLDGEPLPVRPLVEGAAAAVLVDADGEDVMRFVIPAPQGRLALLVEFTLAGGRHPEVVKRIEALMASFRWFDAA